MRIRNYFLFFLFVILVLQVFGIGIGVHLDRVSRRNSLIKITDVEIEKTFTMYKDQIIGNLIVGNIDLVQATLEKIALDENIGFQLNYGEKIFQSKIAACTNCRMKTFNLNYVDKTYGTISIYKTLPKAPNENLPFLLYSFLPLVIITFSFIVCFNRWFEISILVPLNIIESGLKERDNLNLKAKIAELKAVPMEVKKSFESLIQIINEGHKIKLLNEKMEIFKQVSHDIRSPLSALTMVVGTLKEIPEEKRLLIRNATQRINDIANDLLQKGKEDTRSDSATSSNVIPATNTEFIPVIIDILVSEKRMQFREHSGLEIEVDLKDSFGSFAQINSNELKRVISNLVNNAVEAFQKHQGRITVGVRKITTANNQKVEISVKDNGKGIPKHILDKLGQMGVTHGKEDTQSGSGLGVYHAIKTAESFGGTFEIDSVEGKGTTIRIILPLAEPPTWFANKIDLTAKKYLISLDDDISIHQIWAGRLSSLGFNNIEHLRFQSAETFKHYVNSNMNKVKESIFLVDYELLNQPLTGLDIIDELGLEKYSILVTSRYEESAIQDRASRLRLPILPKALAGFVPFEIQKPKEVYDLCLIDDDTQMINRPIETNFSSVKISDEKLRYDLCLIDDDQALIWAMWSMAAEAKGLKIRLFATPQAFVAEADRIDRQTPIYVDVSLGNGVSGLDVAHDIHKMGFTEINLATGYQADSLVVPPFICRVVGKNFPDLGHAGAPTN